MKTALWFGKHNNNKVKCLLCPHYCLIDECKSGICRVRTNIEGELYSDVYGLVSALRADPVEKKPLYHFFPGRFILSIGSIGCNLRCRFCQNCEISQVSVQDAGHFEYYEPEAIVDMARLVKNNIGIAYTYNEPTVWYEYMVDIAQRSKQAGLKNVMVTNGFINPEPLGHLLEFMDAFSVDLKGFTESFYRINTSSHLEPVKNTLEQIHAAGKHLEVVNLVIPTLNDDETVFEEMVSWIAAQLGKETVLHLSAYFPRHRATEPPTPVSTLLRLNKIARRQLYFVYIGNAPDENNKTLCPSCHNSLILRVGYHVSIIGLDAEGRCKSCGFLLFENF